MKKYVFKSYNPSFPLLFEQEKRRIEKILRGAHIEHVGSTAVLGLGGKGIIDIAIAVTMEEMPNVYKILESLGYSYGESGSNEQRWFFKIHLSDTKENLRTYHVHLTFEGSQEWIHLIKFRDYLRNHPEAAQEYAHLKKNAADLANEDGQEYRRLKEPFFKQILG